MPIYRATTQNPLTNIASQPAGNLAASLLDSMYQTIWNVLNDSSNGYATLTSDTGTVNHVILTNLSPALAYRQGMSQSFLTTNANTGPVQVNVDGLGNVSITTSAGLALSGGELSTTAVNVLIYDGTKFRLLLPLGSIASQLLSVAGWATFTGSMVSTNIPASVTNWTQTGSKGVAITLDNTTTNITVPGCSIIQLKVSAPINTTFTVIFSIGLINISGTTIGATSFNSLTTGSNNVTLAGFQTAGTFSVQAFGNVGQANTLTFTMGILTLLL